MKTIKEIAEYIRAKAYLFQLVIPGKSFVHGKTTVSQALANDPSIEAYIERIANENKTNHILVRLFTPNGSAWRNRGEHLIFLTEPNPVATNIQAATPIAMNIEPRPTFSGFGNPTPPKTNDMDSKDIIQYEVLKVKHTMLEGQHEEAKERIKKLEK